MTRPWKLKTNSSNTLLVLITLILIKTEWTRGESDDRTGNDEIDDAEVGIVGNDQIARYYFRSPTKTRRQEPTALIERVNRCLENFQLVTCLKLLLLDRINEAAEMLETPEVSERDLVFFNGLVGFDRKPGKTRPGNDRTEGDSDNLDQEISQGMTKLFRNRLLRVNLTPEYKLEIEPANAENNKNNKNDAFICFRYILRKRTQSESSGRSFRQEARKKSDMGSMMMMMPQMVMLGFLPFTLATIKAFVMNAMMVNMMALNGAIFMTIRNYVFGPRSGGNVQYVNYGYSKDRQTQKKRPVLVLHSPAALVKQPVYHQHSHETPTHYYHSHEAPLHYHHSRETPVHYYHSQETPVHFYHSQETPSHNHYTSRESEYVEDDEPTTSEETWQDSLEDGGRHEKHGSDLRRRRQNPPISRRTGIDAENGVKYYILRKVKYPSTYQQKPKRIFI